MLRARPVSSTLVESSLAFFFRSPDVDFEVRWAMIQLAEMLVRPAEEAIPKVVLHLPPTPALEIPPALPTPKIKFFTGNSESQFSSLFFHADSMLTLPSFSQCPNLRLLRLPLTNRARSSTTVFRVQLSDSPSIDLQRTLPLRFLLPRRRRRRLFRRLRSQE